MRMIHEIEMGISYGIGDDEGQEHDAKTDGDTH
jgi:hypothetical protein